jgi:rhodanese-related sulfurtransferase
MEGIMVALASRFSISPRELWNTIGTADTPQIADVRRRDIFDTAQGVLPGASWHAAADVMRWGRELDRARSVVVACTAGHELSQSAVAQLRADGLEAMVLEGGYVAWMEAHLPLVTKATLDRLAPRRPSLWVTRRRPKIDRVACPWLIRRFIDRDAVFLYVAQSEVLAVAERFGATPFDIDGVFWSHRGEACTFDVMLKEFGLQSDVLDRLALIVRAADTDRLDLAPQAAGLLAASLGFSRMYRDDLEQLDATMALYDSFYRWCRDAVAESHNWPNPGRDS